jgi:hypothetical protein
MTRHRKGRASQNRKRSSRLGRPPCLGYETPRSACARARADAAPSCRSHATSGGGYSPGSPEERFSQAEVVAEPADVQDAVRPGRSAGDAQLASCPLGVGLAVQQRSDPGRVAAGVVHDAQRRGERANAPIAVIPGFHAMAVAVLTGHGDRGLDMRSTARVLSWVNKAHPGRQRRRAAQRSSSKLTVPVTPIW